MAVEEKQLYLRGESRPKLEPCVYNMTKNLVILLRSCVEKAKKFKKKRDTSLVFSCYRYTNPWSNAENLTFGVEKFI